MLIHSSLKLGPTTSSADSARPMCEPKWRTPGISNSSWLTRVVIRVIAASEVPASRPSASGSRARKVRQGFSTSSGFTTPPAPGDDEPPLASRGRREARQQAPIGPLQPGSPPASAMPHAAAAAAGRRRLTVSSPPRGKESRARSGRHGRKKARHAAGNDGANTITTTRLASTTAAAHLERGRQPIAKRWRLPAALSRRRRRTCSDVDEWRLPPPRNPRSPPASTMGERLSGGASRSKASARERQRQEADRGGRCT